MIRMHLKKVLFYLNMQHNLHTNLICFDDTVYMCLCQVCAAISKLVEIEKIIEKVARELLTQREHGAKIIPIKQVDKLGIVNPT